MRTVGEFKAAGVEFVEGDKGEGFEVRDPESFGTIFNDRKVTSFAWRDLTTSKPDPVNLRYKIELDINNHRWRPSLNQGVEYPYEQRVTTAKAKQPEFKVGDLVATKSGDCGVLMLPPDIRGTTIVRDEFGQYTRHNYCDLMQCGPQLDALKDIISLHDDPTECAKAILAAGYTK